MSAPIGGGGGLGGSSGSTNVPSSAETGPRSLQQQMSETEARVAKQRAEAQAERQAQQAEQGKAMAARLETPPTQDLSDLERRLETADQSNPLDVMRAGQLSNEQFFGQEATDQAEPQGPLHNLPNATGAPSRPTGVLREGGQSGFEPTAFAPKPAEEGQSGLVDELPTDTSDKTVAQAAAGREAPAQTSNESLTLQPPTVDYTDMGEAHIAQGTDAASGTVDTNAAQADQQEPSSPAADHPDQPTPDNTARVDTADVQPSSPDAPQPPNAPRPADASAEAQEAVQPPTMPPLSPDAAKAAEAQKAQEKKDYMNGFIKDDKEMRAILDNAGIAYNETSGLDVDAEVKRLEGLADRSVAQERALRRLREVQGLNTLHEGTVAMDALLKSGKDVTQGDGEQEFDDAKAKIEEGRVSEMRRVLRGRIQGDSELQRLLRQRYPNREMEDIIQDLDPAALIKELREMPPGHYHNQPDEMKRDQKILDRLNEYAGQQEQKYGLEDGQRARNDEERTAAIERVAEGEKTQPGALRKAKEKVFGWMSGMSHENLQYLHRQAKGYRKTLKSYEERAKAARAKGDVKGAESLEASIANLKKLSKDAGREWRRKSFIKWAIIAFILSTLAFTVGPALVAPQVFKMAGKSQ